MSGFRRAASARMLRARAAMLAQIRAFLAARGVLEVETPTLSQAGITDLHLEPMVTEVGGLGRRYLHTSPEYAMKRLLADGVGDIYQICRVYRDGEIGRWHQPEFTMLEWYRVGLDEQQLMDEVERLLTSLLPEGTASRRIGWHETFAAAVGDDTAAGLCANFRFDSDDEAGSGGATASDAQAALTTVLRERGCDVPDGLSADALIDLAFSTLVVPALNPSELTFIHDFPTSQAALARLKPGSPAVAARFEAFYGGVELANGFAELTDADEQRQRFMRQASARAASRRAVSPLDEDFLAALERGLPECAGVAVGIDRLLAVAHAATSLSEVMAFVHEPGPRDGTDPEQQGQSFTRDT